MLREDVVREMLTRLERGEGIKRIAREAPQALARPQACEISRFVGPANLLFKSTGQDQSTETQDDPSARNSDNHD